MPAVRILMLAAGLLAASGAAWAQQPAGPSRPKIGLALGGGSARGIAHVGVLEWFEEHHIPIDFVVGTSMGGLVAGAYASGMSPAEIRQMMREADWDLMFLADSPFRYKSFRRKVDKRTFPSQLEFGLKHGLSLPGALNPGQQVALMLDRIALPYGDLQSFDDLPTPFRAVATDLRKGEVVVLGRPPLARAMRATMAIPGVFAPVNWEDWLLVDGGALNNVPADVTRALGADVVIAVNVGADEGDETQQQQSLIALLGRTIDTMMTTSTRRALESATLVIDPDLKGLGSSSWRESDALANRGYQAANAVADRLQAYALSPDAHAAFQSARATKRRRGAPAPMQIALSAIGEPVSPRVERQIRQTLAPLLKQPVDPDVLGRKLLAVSGADQFEYLTYGVTSQPAPATLQIGVRQKTYGPPFLMVGLDLNNIDSSNFAFNLSARVLNYGLLGAGSEERFDFILGTNQRLAGEFLRPLGSTPVFVAARPYFDRRGRNLYVDDIFVADYRIKRVGAGVDIGTDLGRYSQVRVGYDIADFEGRRRVGAPDLPSVDGTEQYVRLDYSLDTQTSPLVPTRGTWIRTSLRHYFEAPKASTPLEGVFFDSPQEFTQLELRGSFFRRVRELDRLFVIAEGGTSFGAHPLVNDFPLGGPLRLGSLNNDQMRGDNYLLGGGGYLRGMGRLPDVLGGSIFLGAWVEAGTAYDDGNRKDWKSDVTGGAILETLLGPLFLGGSVGFEGGGRFYIALGPLFR